MKAVYLIIISKEEDGYFVSIPDFNIDTQGTDLNDAIYMARDAIGLMGITLEDKEIELPQPNTIEIIKGNKDDIMTLVDIDFTEYRKKHDNRAVKKNCTIPYWLNYEAEKVGINFSKTLQEALKQILKVDRNI